MKDKEAEGHTAFGKYVFWGICFILFLPVIILPPSFQPSDWSRAILFRTAIALIGSFLLFEYFYKNRLSIEVPKWKLSDYLPALMLLGFTLTACLSTIFSLDPRFSFFSNPARAGGLLNLFFYFLFAVFLALIIKESRWELLWKFNFAIAAIASLFAFVQSFSFLKNIFISYEGGGPPSFLGNSTFLAIYLFFSAIWAFVLFMQKSQRKQKIIYGSLFLLYALGIFLSGSRAAFLALLTSFLFFFLFYPLKNKKIKIAKIAIICFAGFAVLIVALFNFFPQIGWQNTIFARLQDRLSIQRVAEDLFGTRFAAWQITLKAIKDKPLLGHGPENFYIGFEKYYEPVSSDMQKLWWDRAHNIFLDTAATTGIAGLIFYLGFWVVLFYALQKFKKREGNEHKVFFAHGLQTVFLGYLIILFFNFDSFATYLISYFFIGYAFYLLATQKEHVEISHSQKIINHKNKKIFAAVFCVILLLFVCFWNIKPLYLNESVAYAKNISNIGRCDKALKIMENVNKSPGILKVYNALIYSDVIKKCAVSQEQQVEYATKGANALEQAASLQPYYTRTWLFKGALTNVLAANQQDPAQKQALLDEAMSYFNKALELSPKRAEIYVEIEKNYLVAEDYKSMKEWAKKCIKIDKSASLCYWYLGISEIFLGDQANGKKNIEESLARGGFAPPYIQLGAAYISQKNYVDAADTYRLLTADHPENVGYHAVYAFLLKEIGDYSRAATEAIKVFELQPENPETFQFLQILLGLSPNDPVIHASLAHIYRELGEQEKFMQELTTAKSLYMQLVSQYPNNADYHFQFAGVYAELKDYENSYKQALITISLLDNPNLIKQVEKFIQSLPKEYWARYLKDADSR